MESDLKPNNIGIKCKDCSEFNAKRLCVACSKPICKKCKKYLLIQVPIKLCRSCYDYELIELSRCRLNNK